MDPTLKNIERDLDSKQQAKDAMSQEERSKLVGWSPSLNAMDSTLVPELPSFDLDGGAPPSVGEEAPSQPGAPPAAPEPTQSKEKKGPPANIPPKKAKMSKAERRELQERQRAAKAGKGKGKGGKGGNNAPGGLPPKPSSSGAGKGAKGGGRGGGRGVLQYDDVKAMKGKMGMQRPQSQKQVPLFSHLQQVESVGSLSMNVGFSKNEIHPAILKLGLKYEARLICGANARCVAMLIAFKEVIKDYSTPPNKMLSWDMDKRLKPLINFLVNCRQMSISMGNAIKYLKMHISKVSPDALEADAKSDLCRKIDTFIQERVTFADDVIVDHALSKIQDGDTVLTYARSHVVEKLLVEAHKQGKKFRLIIADSRPLMEGMELRRRLAKQGLNCTYILLNGISYIMKVGHIIVHRNHKGTCSCMASLLRRSRRSSWERPRSTAMARSSRGWALLSSP
jgi:translation initiation factor eIF-2B subunit delta